MDWSGRLPTKRKDYSKVAEKRGLSVCTTRANMLRARRDLPLFHTIWVPTPVEFPIILFLRLLALDEQHSLLHCVKNKRNHR